MAKVLGATRVYKQGATLYLENNLDSEDLIPLNYPDFYPDGDSITFYDTVRNTHGKKTDFTYSVALTDIKTSAGGDMADGTMKTACHYVSDQMAL